ncbi:MAG: antitoxin family protein [Anaerolineae bacterium]
MDTIIAIYEQGVLRPTTPLPLAEHTRVRLQIVEQITDVDSDYPLLTLANLGECQEPHISERVEEILAAEIDPEAGWSVPDADPR